MALLRKIYLWSAGFGLSVSILFFMFAITWLGTLSQAEIGLFQSQKKYFESWVVIQQLFGPIYVPLPGGMLLMSALAVNLTLGGIVRLRRTWSRVGVLITHLGIAMLLVAGLVKFQFSTEGYLRLFEGQTGSFYVSYHDWEVAIAEVVGDAEMREWLVPNELLEDRAGSKTAVVRAAGLPFTLELFGFERNCDALPKGPMFTTTQPVIDGYFLRPRPPEKDAEFDVAGVYARVTAGGARPESAILWGEERAPWTVRAADRVFAVSLRKVRRPMPFAIELKKFTHEFHPGTTMARVFKSDVLVHEGGRPEEMRIEMNQPLRRGGIIAFQSSWGPPNAQPGTRLFSVFAVVENPSDQWPLWSCVVIGIGMAIHFLRMLLRYVRAELEVAR